MKIIHWLADSFSERIGLAIIQVEPDEIADIERMLVLVDGDGSGHYGLQAKLIGEEPFDIKTYARKRWDGKFAMDQFGHPPYSQLIKKRRYYEAHVSRD